MRKNNLYYFKISKALLFLEKMIILDIAPYVVRLIIGINFAVLGGEVAVPCTRNPL